MSAAALSSSLWRRQSITTAAGDLLGNAQPASSGEPGFAWGDFGIGIASAFGLLAVLSGLAVGILTIRRSGQSREARHA